MFVEVTRLLTVLLCTAAGYSLAGRSAGAAGKSLLVGAALGACVGYLVGGVMGRWLRGAWGRAQHQIERTQPAQLLAGIVGAAAVGGVAALMCVPALLLLSKDLASPLYALVVWLAVSAGFRLGAHKSSELLALAGLSTRPLVRASPFGEDPDGDAVILDSSAVIDGRVLSLVRSGFLRGPLLVPRFILDEVQSIADAHDPMRRRQGRRGLEVLDAVRRADVRVHVLDDEMVEYSEVDAKLVALARRLRVALMTVDGPLLQVAELQGVRCLNPDLLAEGLRSAYSSGEVLRLSLTKPGRNEGQCVGFLDDGTMVVVGEAADRLGQDVEVRVTGQVQTTQGRLLFASLADA
jgi:uncharacterized protein YacL